VLVVLTDTEVEVTVTAELVASEDEDRAAIVVLLPGDTYNRISRGSDFKEESFELKYIPKKRSNLLPVLHHQQHSPQSVVPPGQASSKNTPICSFLYLLILLRSKATTSYLRRKERIQVVQHIALLRKCCQRHQPSTLSTKYIIDTRR
jgi:hypothetical protein